MKVKKDIEYLEWLIEHLIGKAKTEPFKIKLREIKKSLSSDSENPLQDIRNKSIELFGTNIFILSMSEYRQLWENKEVLENEI